MDTPPPWTGRDVYRPAWPIQTARSTIAHREGLRMTTVVITGAGGNIGTKLRRHFESLGWSLRLLDASASDPGIGRADLAVWDDAWVQEFRDADAVIHLAADRAQRRAGRISFASISISRSTCSRL